MSRVARYAKITAHPGKGDELADGLLRAAEGLRGTPGCELYIVNRVPDEPEVVWVTELWESGDALDAALRLLREDEEGAATMRQIVALGAEFDRVDLEPVGGVGLAPRPAPGWHKLAVDELEDLAKGYGMGGIQEMRQLDGTLGLQRTGLSLQKILPGQRQSFGHTHVNAEETYVILAGGGTLKLADEEVALAARDALRVAPELTRAFEAGPDGLEYLALGPKTKGDGAMTPGWWGGAA